MNDRQSIPALAFGLIPFMLLTPRAYADAESANTEPEKKAPQETVVVTATRSPIPTRELGAQVIVISAEDIRKSGASNLADLLTRQAGISVRRSGGPGANTEISIRGDRSGHTLIMLDGVELSDASTIDNNFEISQIPLEGIDRVEILKGPHSVAYAGSGLSGVVHVISKKPGAGRQGLTGLEYGSYRDRRLFASYSARQEAFAGDIYGNWQKREGYSTTGSRDQGEADGLTRKDGTARLSYQASERSFSEVYLRFHDSLADLDEQIGAVTLDDPNYQARREEQSLQLLQKFRWSPSTESTFRLSQVKMQRRFRDDPDFANPNRSQTWQDYRYEGWRTSFLASQFWQISEDHSLLLSWQSIQDQADFSSEGLYEGFYSLSMSPKISQKEQSSSLQWQGKFLSQIFLQSGVRQIQIQQNKQQTIGQASMNVHLLGESLQAKANIGRGYKYSSLYQRKDPIYGNADLKAESTMQQEIGLTWQQAGWQAEWSLFQQEDENLLIFDLVKNRFENLDRTRKKGWETQLGMPLTDDLRVLAQATHLKNIDRSSGESLPYYPSDSFAVQAFWDIQRHSLHLSHRGQSRTKGKGSVASVAAYALTDFNYQLNLGADSYSLSVDNVGDAHYQEVNGFNQAGRSFRIKYQRTW